MEKEIIFKKSGVHAYKGSLYLPFMPPWLIEQAAQLPMTPQDVLFGTYPRSGTPLLAELMWLIHNKAHVDSARKTRHGVRVRFLEHLVGDFNPIEYLKKQPHPRLLKSHLPAAFFHKQITESGVKAVVMIRNLKDTLLSMYRFYTADPGYVGYKGTWDEFFEIFKADQIFGGNWIEHTQSWLQYAQQQNVLVLRYEEVCADPIKHIDILSVFCNQELAVEQQSIIADYMINDVAEECYIGEWKKYFSKKQEEYIDNLLKQNNVDF